MGVVDRWNEARSRIDRAARESGRDPKTVTLVCVTKTFPSDAIVPLLEAGQRVFGENRVQEAKEKWPDLKARYPGVELHLLGPLQSNKVKEAIETFDVIQSLDREKIARALSVELAKSNKPMRFLVQVNTGAEPQKSGVLVEEADAFIALCRDELGLPVQGLMCVPPVDEQASPHFALLSTIAARNGLSVLSMGMSADFEQAVELGATHVRVGSAIMGERD
ncbi:YggS family pyridoxal phosphate-dependent enzyme [Methylocystis bryophila]|uniref:Pyridoxal phosphate homeostasis protein n=1 Tax=Methylocystis bryophila TaxID=655015 RepID=A0A1W6MX94_9HYPH|nr:YggS family pyridoxal phosphate-dependent enzyme [Methylocystis bryophila]ARN82200.1 YggS family pyridoxal phosphate enzyme [Methylocystis bryophila]BDV38332.1 YggS family pyridoxal phosphate enzyme [Methylocystis bryophila]